MWDLVAKVGTGLALVAFIVAAITTLLRQRLIARERQLLATPERDRANVVQALNDTFLVPSLPIDPGVLTPDQRYSLLLEQIHERSRRFLVTSLLIFALACLVAAITAFAITRTQSDPTDKEQQQVTIPTPQSTTTTAISTAPAPPTDTAPPRNGANADRPPLETVVETHYTFEGPIRVSRSDNDITFALTEPKTDKSLADKDVSVESASISFDVEGESTDPFAFDIDLLVFSADLDTRPAIRSGTDWQVRDELERSYCASRRAFQLALRTDANRQVNSTGTLTSYINFADGSASPGELKKVRQGGIRIGDGGARIQLFMWTLWGGDHFVNLSDIQVHLKIRKRTRATA